MPTVRYLSSDLTNRLEYCIYTRSSKMILKNC